MRVAVGVDAQQVEEEHDLERAQTRRESGIRLDRLQRIMGPTAADRRGAVSNAIGLSKDMCKFEQYRDPTHVTDWRKAEKEGEGEGREKEEGCLSTAEGGAGNFFQECKLGILGLEPACPEAPCTGERPAGTAARGRKPMYRAGMRLQTGQKIETG